MTQPSSIAKGLSSSHGDRLIRALIAEGKGFNATTFSENEIERVMEIGEDHSALVLRSGVKVPLALSYEELERKIYQPDFKNDGPVLDLRDVTGEAATPKAANANETSMPKGGDRMPDGSVCAGISPDTNKPMYVTPADASRTMTFEEAKEYAAHLDAHGHQDWRIPTKSELCVIFNRRAEIGGFNRSGPNPAGWYWSASPNLKWGAWGQRFRDGTQNYYLKDCPLSVRPVR